MQRHPPESASTDLEWTISLSVQTTETTYLHINKHSFKWITLRKKVIYGRLRIEQLSDGIASESSGGFKHKGRRDDSRERADLGAESLHQVSLLPSLQTQKSQR